MNHRIYITNDTFTALTSFIKKGIEQNMFFFIYDTHDLIKNRLWTFSSTAFIPNINIDDPIAEKHKIPVIISNKNNVTAPDGYTKIMFEMQNIENFDIAFVKNRMDAKSVISVTNKTFEIFEKDTNSWKKVTVL